jgi:hypothetical protein
VLVALALRSDTPPAPAPPARPAGTAAPPGTAPTPLSVNVDDGPPKPAEWIQAGAAVVAAAAVVVGGGLAYRRLRHSRGFEPMLKLDVAASRVEIAGTPGLHVTITATNTGLSTLLFDRVAYDYRVRVIELRTSAWIEAANGTKAGYPRELYWDGARHTDVQWMKVLHSAGALESGLLFRAPGRPDPTDHAEPGQDERVEATPDSNRIWLRPDQSLSRDLLVPGFSGAAGHLLVVVAEVCSHAWLGTRLHEKHCTRADAGLRRKHFDARTLVMAKTDGSRGDQLSRSLDARAAGDETQRLPLPE